MPRVAVVIPAYNAEATLERTVTSILTQTLGDFELVITDDGSVDGTLDLAQSFARNDDRVTVISQSNSGLADARNSGVQNSSAPLVAAIDCDDIWHSTFLERLTQAFGDGSSPIVAAYANSRVIDMADQVIWNAPAFGQSGWVFNQLLMQNFIGNGSAMMFRRDVATQVGLYERELQYTYRAAGCEDWLLALKLAAQGEFVAVREYLVGYRAVPGAMSQNTLRMRRSRLFALEILFKEIDPNSCKAGRWALGLAHAKCFLHELRALQFPAAARNLAAAISLDFTGTSRLLFGSERMDWLLDKIPWHEQSQTLGNFADLDTREGQWDAHTERAAAAHRWDIESGRIAAPF